MTTKSPSVTLLPDEVWSQIPRTSADRRFVAISLLVLLLMIPALIVGNSTGILVPRLSNEGGEASISARPDTIRLRAVVHNESSRSWRITGATVDAPGLAHSIRINPVTVAAHRNGTVAGTVHIDDCAAATAASNDQANSFNGDIEVHVRRLFGTSTVTINTALNDDLIAMACRS